MGGMGGMDGMPGMGGDEGDMEGGGMGGMGGGIAELASVEEFEQFLDDSDASVVAAISAKMVKDPTATMPDMWDEDEDGEWSAPEIENPMLTELTALATGALSQYRLAYSSDAGVLAKLKAKSDGVYLYRSPRYISAEHGDRPRERFPGKTVSESAMRNWLTAKAQPLVGEYNFKTKERYTQPVLVVYMNLDVAQNAKSVAYVLKRARKAAAGFKADGKRLSVAVASLLEPELKDFGLVSTNKNSDILMGLVDGDTYYRPAGGDGAGKVAFSAGALAEFARGFLAGELTPYEKPEEEYKDDEATGGEGDDDFAEEGDEPKDEP